MRLPNLIFKRISNLIFRASLPFLFFLLISCGSSNSTFTWEALGTSCTVTLFEFGSEKIHSEILMRISEIDSMFSVNKKDSDISKVNENAGVASVAVHADVAEVLSFALEIAEKSCGAFDPSVGPLVRLWGINTENARVPSDSEIETARSLVDWKKVRLEGREVFLEEKGMSLDLGGIAKGYAADEIVRILEKHRVKRAVIDLGGNIYVYGRKKNGEAWRVGVRNPREKDGNPILTLRLDESGSVVTSGVYERFFERDGKIYHHILDPKSGRPSNSGILSVTIVDSSSMRADALSTTAFILGPERFQELFKSGAIFIDENLSVKICGSVPASAHLFLGT